MANIKEKRTQNVDGHFYVDSNCINCGTCYWVASKTFALDGGQSAVYKQPSKEEEYNAYRALLSCPVFAIGVTEQSKVKEVVDSLPHEIEGGIYHCGYHARNSFGATSYFIQREKGNFLVDAPRYVQRLENKIHEMGGLALQLLTHKDDIADTDEYWNKFKTQRYIHTTDTNSSTAKYEVLMEGEEPFQIDEDILVIPVPGHTEGSVCYLYKEKYLFTGDHLAFSQELNHLFAFKKACWYNFDIQIQSMEKLLQYDFEHVLPGHGRPFSASPQEMKASLKKCIAWMNE